MCTYIGRTRFVIRKNQLAVLGADRSKVSCQQTRDPKDLMFLFESKGSKKQKQNNTLLKESQARGSLLLPFSGLSWPSPDWVMPTHTVEGSLLSSI